MLLVAFGGIFIISTLIGLLGSGIEEKLQELRKGRSKVIETNHIVILGWSLQIFTLLYELIISKNDHAQNCIVILSELDKVEMDDIIQERIGKINTRIVCRTGTTSDIDDLRMVGVQSARAVIVLNSQTESSDVDLIKTLLAITSIPREVDSEYHIVAQVDQAKTLEIVQLIGGNQVETLLTNDLISRLMVQTCRQSGLSSVYMEIVSFEGNEIYFKLEPTLVGKTYGEALLAYGHASLIGVSESDNTIWLNPEHSRIFKPGDQVIVVTKDSTGVKLGSSDGLTINQSAIVTVEPTPPAPEKTLILGWNQNTASTICELDAYVPDHSLVTVVAEIPEGEEILADKCASLTHQTVKYIQGDITERAVLESLDIAQYNQLMVVSDSSLETELADSKTLVTLLQVRDIANQTHSNGAVVAEILDVRNQVLAQVAKPDDFVISEQIISRLLAQVAEQKYLNQVFKYLFSPEQAEVYLKPIINYVKAGESVDFYTVAAAASKKGESPIGYRIQAYAKDPSQNYGVVVNPDKSQVVTFQPGDKLVVVAND
jgi:voltage-gated potassium channel Kch